MPTGRVKWFSDQKGYGFIQSEDEAHVGKDIFVHYSEVIKDGYRFLTPGQLVEFEVTDTDKGLQAKNVKVIDQGSESS